MTEADKDYKKSMENWFKSQDLLIEVMVDTNNNLIKEVKLKQKQQKLILKDIEHESGVLRKSIIRFDKWLKLAN